MKHIVLSLLIMIFFVSCGQDSKVQKKNKKSSQTKQSSNKTEKKGSILTQGVWNKTGKYHGGNELSFENNGTVDLGIYATEEGVRYSGKYTFKNKTVKVTEFKASSSNYPHKKLPSQFTCTLKENKLICSTGNTYISSIIKEADGKALSIGGVQAVTFAKTMTTTTNLVIREKPSTSSKKIFYDDVWSNKHKFIPSGTKIEITARTKEKKKVGKWNNYWYYTYVTHRESGPGSVDTKRKGWIFGEFVK